LTGQLLVLLMLLSAAVIPMPPTNAKPVVNNAGAGVSNQTGGLCQTPHFGQPRGFPVGDDTTFLDNPDSVAAVDLNQDNAIDFIVTQLLDTMQVRLGDGNGGFGPPTTFVTGANPGKIVTADFNLDGKPDLATGNGPNVSVFLGNGSGGFGTRTDLVTGIGFESIAVADFNLDGKPDLVAAGAADSKVTVFLGDGSGNFSTHQRFGLGESPFSLVAGDFNLDGKPDLALACRSSQPDGNGSVFILLGNGNGTFIPALSVGLQGQPPIGCMTMGDFNLDGKPDLAVVDVFGASVAILQGAGDGRFARVRDIALPFRTGEGAADIVTADFNLDGFPDLAVSGSTFPGELLVLLGTGDGGFAAPTSYKDGSTSGRMAVADVNNDGKPDIAVTSPQGVAIFLNTCGNP